MDYIILGFIAFGVLAYMIFKAKLALIDAGTPKFGYPMGGPAEGSGSANIHDRYRSSSILSLFFVFGAILLIAYFMIRIGHNPNAGTDYVLQEVFQQETYHNTPDHYRQTPGEEPRGEVANNPNSNRVNERPILATMEEATVNRAPQEPTVTETVEEKTPRFDMNARRVPVGGGYWLQVVALTNESKAFEQAAYYQDIDGMEAKVVPENGYYKVRIGPFRSRAEARAMRSKHKASWFIVED
ncbi:MAG: SPOR domain-containing protein [Bacteroidota bacterium]